MDHTKIVGKREIQQRWNSPYDTHKIAGDWNVKSTSTQKQMLGSMLPNSNEQFPEFNQGTDRAQRMYNITRRRLANE